MRVIIIGCEYSGVTTLIDGLMKWGDEWGIHHHLDDHFTILTPAQLLQSFLDKSLPHLNTRDMLTRLAGKVLL